MYTIILKNDKSITARLKSTTNIGDSLSKSLEFIIPKTIDGMCAESIFVFLVLHNCENGNFDFIKIEKTSDYNSDFSNMKLLESSISLSSNLYNISIVFFDPTTEQQIITDSVKIEVGGRQNREDTNLPNLLNQVLLYYNKIDKITKLNIEIQDNIKEIVDKYKGESEW